MVYVRCMPLYFVKNDQYIPEIYFILLSMFSIFALSTILTLNSPQRSKLISWCTFVIPAIINKLSTNSRRTHENKNHKTLLSFPSVANFHWGWGLISIHRILNPMQIQSLWENMAIRLLSAAVILSEKVRLCSTNGDISVFYSRLTKTNIIYKDQKVSQGALWSCEAVLSPMKYFILLQESWKR